MIDKVGPDGQPLAGACFALKSGNITIAGPVCDNGDGANDVYYIHGLDAFPRNTFLVVNRWGSTVYETINYRNDWTGTNMNGEPLPNGTYFVLLSAADGAIQEQCYVDLRR